MGKIVVAGSINMDVVAQTATHPRPGETVFGHKLHYIPGGKGSNQAVAASRLSDHVYLVGKLGRDPFGDSLTQFLSDERLSLDYLRYSDDKPTGVALITVNEASENTIVVISGSNFELSVEDVRAMPLDPDDVVVSVFEIPQETIKALFSRAKDVGATTILNPAPATDFIDGLLPLVDYLIVNETELATFADSEIVNEDPEHIHALVKRFRASTAQTIIVTLGAKGVICVHNDDLIQIAGRSVKAIDTTGAGDCFTGAFATACFENMPLRDAIQFANKAAALSVQKLGASSSMPYRVDVDSL